jgi:hypothetical protein
LKTNPGAVLVWCWSDGRPLTLSPYRVEVGQSNERGGIMQKATNYPLLAPELN